MVTIPFGAAWADKAISDILRSGVWRPMLVPGILILYIWLVSPLIHQSQLAVIRSMRPILGMDDETFEELIRKNSKTVLWKEILAIVIGSLVGFFLSRQSFADDGLVWLQVYWVSANCWMFGLLSWTIYGSFDSTRLVTALHRQELHFDLFDLRPFEPVGRYSLLLALVFIGGLSLGLIFSLSVQNIAHWETWIVFVPMALLPILLFFLNMRNTHGVLAKEKRRLLQFTSQRLASFHPKLHQAVVQGLPILDYSAEYAALSAYENHLLAARTWPYNTAMVRTLGFSVALPILVRLASLLLFGE